MPKNDTTPIDLDNIEIEIVNFDKYQTKSNAKRNHWFALDVDFLTHKKFYRQDHRVVLVWLWCVGHATAKQRPRAVMNWSLIGDALRITRPKLQQIIIKLQVLDLIRVHEPQSGPYITEHNKTEQERTIQEIKKEPAVSLPEINHLPKIPEPGMPDIQGLWNRICGGKFKQVMLLSSHDQHALLALWSKHPDVTIWQKVFENLVDEKSIFVLPDKKKSGWQPTFGWVISQDGKFFTNAFNENYLSDGIEAESKKDWMELFEDDSNEEKT